MLMGCFLHQIWFMSYCLRVKLPWTWWRGVEFLSQIFRCLNRCSWVALTTPWLCDQLKALCALLHTHYDDVIMTMLASQITSLTVVYSIVYSGVNQRKHQSSASLAFVREIHRGPVNFPQKWPVTRKMFPFDDVIMLCCDFAMVGGGGGGGVHRALRISLLWAYANIWTNIMLAG